MAEARRSSRKVRFGLFEVDLQAGELRKRGRKLKLHGQPIRILEVLLERRGEVVSRDELRDRIWPGGDTFVDFDHSINTAVNRLRETLGDSAEKARFVETVPRRGYRFIAPVDEEVALQAAEIAQEPKSKSSQRRVAVFSLLALLSAAVYSGLYRPWTEHRPPSDRTMLAVLPFENLSGNPDEEYYSDGITEELIARLGRLNPEQLRIIARTSAMHYKGTRKRADQIGSELGVEFILEGSVRRQGQRVRINAQLVQASTQIHLWAESYDRRLDDIFAVQDDVARSIARQIELKLSPLEGAVGGPEQPVKAEAHEFYLKGRYFWNKRTEKGFQQAIAYFRRAIEVDPRYALPYAGLADCFVLLGYYSLLPPHQAYPDAEAAARKALEMDESLGEAHSSLAGVFMDYKWNWAEVEREYRRALELAPGYPTAYQWYGNYLNAMGRLSEGIEAIRQARKLDPLSPIISTNLGWAYYLARQQDKALEEARRALELDPDLYWAHSLLGRVYVQKGAHQEAIAAFEKARLLSGGNSMVLAELGHAYGAAGQHPQARRILADLQRPTEANYASPYDIGLVYLGLGQTEEALVWLEKSYQERARPLGFSRVEPRLDPLRSDPRFGELLRRMNFPER